MKSTPIPTEMRPSKMGDKRSVLLIYTGGTIGMVKNPTTGALEAFDFDHIQMQVREMEYFGFKIDTLVFDPPLDSSDVGPKLWVDIANTIYHSYDTYTGFVILHGSDTMAYTASALSFMLEGLSKPVLLTGSQLPIDSIRTDGKENLLTSIEIAAACDKDGYPYVQEVCVVFNNRLLRGNRSTKISTENFSAFKSPNYPALANIGIDIDYNFNLMLPRVSSENPTYPKLTMHLTLETNILVIRIIPGLSINTLRQTLALPEIKGVVIETFGNGNAPTSPEFLQVIKESVDRGVVVVNVTQCLEGKVEMQRYKTGVSLLKAGVVSGADITVEAAVTKLMILLGSGNPIQEVKTMMSRNLLGETTL